ncbi:MAG: GMC family oxidoreductase N-terminal domain-containing protein [Bacteroidota bacterium]
MKWDYIVIGAGTAGCVVASRLSEPSNVNVLLLEAGTHDRKIEVKMPVGYPKVQQTKRDWDYRTTPQRHLNNRILHQPRGKMLGGTGSMNGMIYIRGHQADFNDWAKVGNTGWDYESVLPYFKKSEANRDFDNEYHNTNGPMAVGSNHFAHPLNEAFLKAGQEAGFPLNPDFNGANMEGVGYFQATVANGERISSANAFWYPVRKRENLILQLHCEVNQLIVEKGVCKGVQISRKGKTTTIYARKGVICCAGAINSPKILQLSGIGDQQQLEGIGITIKEHLPGVGKNLQDHVQYFAGHQCLLPVSLNTSLKISNLWKYFVSRKGILSASISATGGFVKTHKDLDRPDIQFHFVPGIAGDDIHNLKAQPKYDGYMLGLTLLRPKARGTVCLASKIPQAAPLIEGNFLNNPLDVETLKRAWPIGKRILEADAFFPFRGDWELPKKPFENDQQLEQYIREKTDSVYHSAGTCRMGQDSEAVCDKHLKVHGIRHLWVADASVMPTITAGNINAAVVMIAEKLADHLLHASNS